jgi:methionyl-tRNA synthetase
VIDEINTKLNDVYKTIDENNKFIEDNKPWELIKSNPEKCAVVIEKLLVDLNFIAELLVPFLPETSVKIKIALETKKIEPLFQRIK